MTPIIIGLALVAVSVGGGVYLLGGTPLPSLDVGEWAGFALIGIDALIGLVGLAIVVVALFQSVLSGLS